jgi:OOP family OmpA-OmpF porin
MRFMMVLAAAAVLAGPAAAQIAPVIVYFEAKSDVLTPAARERLDAIPAQLRTAPDVGQILVMGHADSSEGDEDGVVGLTQYRASIVREYLIAAGVPDGIVTTAAFGSTRPALESSEPQPENRRVEITFGPGSGW